MRQKRNAEADGYYREILERGTQTDGGESMVVLHAGINLGMSLMEQGKLKEAEPYLLQAIDLFPRLLGTVHLDTLKANGTIAKLYALQNRPEEAIPHYRKAVELSGQLFGDENPQTIFWIVQMTHMYMRHGKTQEAECLAQEVMEASRKRSGTAHVGTLQAIGRYALVLKQVGKHKEAQEILSENLAAASLVWKTDDPFSYANYLLSLGWFHFDLDEIDTAERYYLEGLAILDELPDDRSKAQYEILAKELVEIYMNKHAAEPEKGFDTKADEWNRKLKELKPAQNDDPSKNKE
jgi:tetratricopeptide (TPR) repeat protein